VSDPATVLGTAGVALLLVGFVLNGIGVLTARDRRYLLLNAVGAGLACWASVLLAFVPFVVLEGTWCLAAAAGLARASSR
jgi:hypothetical protein